MKRVKFQAKLTTDRSEAETKYAEHKFASKSKLKSFTNKTHHVSQAGEIKIHVNQNSENNLDIKD